MFAPPEHAADGCAALSVDASTSPLAQWRPSMACPLRRTARKTCDRSCAPACTDPTSRGSARALRPRPVRVPGRPRREVTGLGHADGTGREDDLPILACGHPSFLRSSAPKLGAPAPAFHSRAPDPWALVGQPVDERCGKITPASAPRAAASRAGAGASASVSDGARGSGARLGRLTGARHRHGEARSTAIGSFARAPDDVTVAFDRRMVLLSRGERRQRHQPRCPGS
jgi:hypothetical protein